MLMPPIGNTITLFCSLKNWLNVWKSFLRGKKPGLRHQQTCCLLFHKILWVHFFPFFKKTKGKKKDELPVTKNKSFSLNFFSNSRNKKAAIDEFEQIRFVCWFVCLCSVVAAFYVCIFPFSAWEEEEEETYKERKMVHLHSWSDSLRAANRFESRLTWSALANRMLLLLNELWLWLLGPRFKNGFPWMIRTPFFSSSHWKKEAAFVVVTQTSANHFEIFIGDSLPMVFSETSS